MDARLEKLQALQLLREQAQSQNFQLTKEEQFKKEEQVHEKTRATRKLNKLVRVKEKEEAAENGTDLERLDNIHYSIEDVNGWNKKLKEKKKNTDPWFSDYGELSYRKYKKQITELQPDLTFYKKSKVPTLPLPSSGGCTLSTQMSLFDFKPDEEKKTAMVKDLDRQLAVRSKFSRRRKWKEDEDITYINERNYRFNKKIARAFDPYTKDLKQSLERGTAL